MRPVRPSALFSALLPLSSLGVGLLVMMVVLSVAGVARADDLVLDLGGTTLDTRKVEHGTFTEGAVVSETLHDKDEEPAHQVTISHDFWIGKYPVTRGQFAKFVADTRYITDAEKNGAGGSGWDGHQLVQKKDYTWRNPGFTQTDEHPVVLVTFGDATAFVGWASRKTGKRVRLPTEAEWEYAARGGTTTPWYSGATEADNLGIGWFKAGAGGTRPVGQKKPNPFGLFDMSGDVYEWCRDIYAPYKDGPATDPEVLTGQPGEPERRVLRGGSWSRDIKRARSGARFKNSPGSRVADNGFRVLVTSEELMAPGLSNPGSDLTPVSPVGLNGSPTPMGTGGSPGSPGSPGSVLGPLADGEPVRLEPIPPAGEFSWSVLLASPLAAASAVVAWMLLRRKRTAAPRAVAPVGVTTRLGEDGFFVRAPRAAAGSRARYECLVDGAPVADVVPLAGEETFVYTGSPPTLIRIVEILAAGVAEGRAEGAGPPSSRPRPPPVSARPPVSPPPPLVVTAAVGAVIAEAEAVESANADAAAAVDALAAARAGGAAAEGDVGDGEDGGDQATVPLVMPGSGAIVVAAPAPDTAAALDALDALEKAASGKSETASESADESERESESERAASGDDGEVDQATVPLAMPGAPVVDKEQETQPLVMPGPASSPTASSPSVPAPTASSPSVPPVSSRPSVPAAPVVPVVDVPHVSLPSSSGSMPITHPSVPPTPADMVEGPASVPVGPASVPTGPGSAPMDGPSAPFPPSPSVLPAAMPVSASSPTVTPASTEPSPASAPAAADAASPAAPPPADAPSPAPVATPEPSAAPADEAEKAKADAPEVEPSLGHPRAY